MSRSVSTHRHAVATVFLYHDCEEAWQFDDFLEAIRESLEDKYPSLRRCNRWAGREDHVILENDRAEVSVSEYCGLVAVCLAPRDPDNPLDQGWTWQCKARFEKHLKRTFSRRALRSVGRLSNGEQVFTRATV